MDSVNDLALSFCLLIQSLFYLDFQFDLEQFARMNSIVYIAKTMTLDSKQKLYEFLLTSG